MAPRLQRELRGAHVRGEAYIATWNERERGKGLNRDEGRNYSEKTKADGFVSISSSLPEEYSRHSLFLRHMTVSKAKSFTLKQSTGARLLFKTPRSMRESVAILFFYFPFSTKEFGQQASSNFLASEVLHS